MRITLLRIVLLLIGIGELIRASLFLFYQPLAYDLLQIPLLDPLVSRQYGLFLLPTALLCFILARDPVRYSRFVWVIVAQRALEIALALADWFIGDLPTPTFLVIMACEVVLLVALVALNQRATHIQSTAQTQQYRGMRRLLSGFGILFLFWAVASTIFIQVGAWLLDYPVLDIYTTKQQGVTFLVLGLTSWLAAKDVDLYRLLILVPLSSQILGSFNAAFETFLMKTVPLSGAIVQWTIQGILIGLFIWLYPRDKEDRLSVPALEDVVTNHTH